jgi:hypothetical protein
MVFRSEAGAERFSLSTRFSQMPSDKAIGLSNEGRKMIFSGTSGGSRVVAAVFVAVEPTFVEHVYGCRHNVFDAERVINGKESAADSCAVTARSARRPSI